MLGPRKPKHVLTFDHHHQHHIHPATVTCCTVKRMVSRILCFFSSHLLNRFFVALRTLIGSVKRADPFLEDDAFVRLFLHELGLTY